jgi:tetratricopeptide (TPR) repeat protein
MKQQRLGAALLYFQQAILINSRSQTAVEGLAAVYRHAIVDPRMIAKLERTADTPPRSSALMEIAGRLYAGHHLYNDAARCLKRSIEIDHRQVTAAMVLAETAVEQKKDHGLDQLESMVEELGGSAQSLLAAVKAQDENQLDLAMEKYEAAVRQREHSGVAANNLAWLYAQRGQNLDRALELARSAHDSDPKNLAIMDTLGFVHLARREYSQAVAVLKDATLLAKNKQMASVDEETRSSLRKHLAEAYLRIGQPEDADSALRNK